MSKTLLGNSLLLGVFLFLLALPLGAFGILRYSGSPMVLSATVNDYGGKLQFGREFKPLLVKEITATALAGQRAKYDDVLQVVNSSTTAKTYKITVLRSSSAEGVSSRWLFSNGQPTVTLKSGELGNVSLEITSTSITPQIPIDYLVAIED